MAAPIRYHAQQVQLNPHDLSCRSELWSAAEFGGLVAGTMTGVSAVGGFCVVITTYDITDNFVWIPIVLTIVSVSSFILAAVGHKRHNYYQTLRAIPPEILQLQQQL